MSMYVVPKKDVQKLDARTGEALMKGYSTQSKGYKLWDADARKFFCDTRCNLQRIEQ